MQDDKDPVQALVGQGRHEEAAVLALSLGRPAAALQIYEKLWMFVPAMDIAVQMGDWPRAVKFALEARQPQKARQHAQQVDGGDPAVLMAVSQAFCGRGFFEDAADFARRAGEIGKAADLYRRGGVPLMSARMLCKNGQLREAAELLVLMTNDGHPAGAVTGQRPDRDREEAILELGQLLALLGRDLPAARTLQKAAANPDTAVAAMKNLCVVLLSMQLPGAAEEVARRLHTHDPSLAPSATVIAASITATLPRQAIPERFVVESLLGAGSTGRVYLAQDRLLGRPVALKALSVGASGAENEALGRFFREAEVTGRLQHPHIVGLLDVDSAAQLLVLEYLPGGSLRDKLRQNERLPMASVRRLGLELLAALQQAHAAGIIHRDVKPANVFFDGAGGAKLGDFGAAHILDFGQTQTGGLIGTLAYISPEQISGAPIGPGADLYALAATLFEALAGEPPFPGPDFVGGHLSDPPPLLRNRLPDLPPVVDEVLQKALTKAPQDRFASAAAFAKALQQWPVGDGVSAVVAANRDAIAARARPPTDEPSGGKAQTRALRTALGACQWGELFEEQDDRVERTTIVLVRKTAFNELEMRKIRQMAALGGPHVQRILSLSPDRRELHFEALQGESTPLAEAEISHKLRGELQAKATQLGLAAPTTIVWTNGHPVLRIQPLIKASA